jgi:hypothetical protein
MSLDVSLIQPGVQGLEARQAIFIRREGSLVEISRDEWDNLYPDREPVTVTIGSDNEEVYTANITHNLNKMAEAAGIYLELWRPDEIGVTKASELIEPLEAGLRRLNADPYTYRGFNPKNGWGTYEGLVQFVSSYLEACVLYPDAEVRVSR